MIYASLRTHYGLDLSYIREYKREKYLLLSFRSEV